MSEGYLEIEKLADLKAKTSQDEIVFDNEGNMHANNRSYRRDMKHLWRAVTEGQKSLHFYTKPKQKTTRKSKKAERQNKKKGRR